MHIFSQLFKKENYLSNAAKPLTKRSLPSDYFTEDFKSRETMQSWKPEIQRSADFSHKTRTTHDVTQCNQANQK